MNLPHPPATARIHADLTEATIRRVIESFYEKVRADATLGPVFSGIIGANWGAHVATVCAFWRYVTRIDRAYQARNFMPAHTRHLEIRAALLPRWLELFRQTAHERCPGEVAGALVDIAERMAESIEMSLARRDGATSAESGRASPAGDASLDRNELVLRLTASFRRHPHINNVLTHISGASWLRVNEALGAIFEPRARWHDLSPLARNIVELMCADRGVTGRILKPYYQEWLVAALGERTAGWMIADVNSLFRAREIAAQPEAMSAAAEHEYIEEQDRCRTIRAAASA